MSILLQWRNGRGLVVDIRVRLWNGYLYRERRKAPIQNEASALRWAKKREAHLLAHGPDSVGSPRAASKVRCEPRDGWIYFARGGRGKVKIGWTADVLVRMAELQTGSSEALVVLGVRSGAIADERELHRRFDHLREHGEWFRLEDEIVEYIRTATQAPPGATRCPRLPATP